MDHFRTNLKKERLLEERYMEIDRENRVLLRKMSEAMRKPNRYAQDGAENRPVSLNRQGRKQELLRITKDNQRMLQAIQAVQPVYNHRRWEENFRKSEAHLRNCCAFPVITRLPRGRSSSMLVQMGSGHDELGGRSPGAVSGSGAEYGTEATGEEDRKFVFKEGKRIGQTYYLLEMSTDGRALTVSAYNGETQTSMELIVKEKVHRQLYRECSGDYALIADRLRVDGDRLVLEASSAD